MQGDSGVDRQQETITGIVDALELGGIATDIGMMFAGERLVSVVDALTGQRCAKGQAKELAGLVLGLATGESIAEVEATVSNPTTVGSVGVEVAPVEQPSTVGRMSPRSLRRTTMPHNRVS